MGLSTETALHQAVSTIEGQIDHSGVTLGLVLDIEEAFNDTNTDIICSKIVRKELV